MSNIDNQPLRYWNGNAVYLTLYLTLGFAAGILITFFLIAAQPKMRASRSDAMLEFSPFLFLRGALWQPFTYVFVNPPNFFTPFGLLCFYSWGVEVEKYLGRRFFLGLLARCSSSGRRWRCSSCTLGFTAAVASRVIASSCRRCSSPSPRSIRIWITSAAGCR